MLSTSYVKGQIAVDMNYDDRLDEILEVFKIKDRPEDEKNETGKSKYGQSDFDIVQDLLKIRTLMMTSFLKQYTPAIIEHKLNERIIGQEELTKSVADFLYYHALRFLHPELPHRPMIIYGPSGSGKTEVWRVARKLFGHTFHISIVDGSQITCEGWTGNIKLANLIDDDIAAGGILVIDEFDKLARPHHNSSGENVSESTQSELLKFLEGEYEVDRGKSKSWFTSSYTRKINTTMSGAAMIGAFESLREKKAQSKAHTTIGFNAQQNTSPNIDDEIIRLSDEDFIEFGIMPEIVGRIALNCPAKQLNDKDYMEILKNPYSRVSAIAQMLKSYQIDPYDAIKEEEVREMIAKSKSNRTGVRWVSAQVEGKMLDLLRQADIRWLIVEAPNEIV
jgi:ATP-dependent Clp protease ATP-binding subunit ClpX